MSLSAENIPRTFLIPVNGVDPSSQRTYLSSALTTSNNMYKNAVEQIDNIVSSKVADNHATLPTVDDKLASETKFNKDFISDINKKENFIINKSCGCGCGCNHCGCGNSHIVPRLVEIAKKAAVISGEQPDKQYIPLNIDDALGSGKLNNQVIKDYMMDDRSSSPKTAVDEILKQYIKDNKETEAPADIADTISANAADEVSDEIPGNNKVIIKQEPNETNETEDKHESNEINETNESLTTKVLLVLIIALLVFIIVIFFTNLLRLSTVKPISDQLLAVDAQ